MHLIPAYGRDYKTRAEVLADWIKGKDFIIADMSSKWDGKPTNNTQCENECKDVTIRFARLTKQVIIINQGGGKWTLAK